MAMTCPRSPAGDGVARSTLVPGAPRPKATTSSEGTGRDSRPAMTKKEDATGSSHLWAIGYDDMERADHVRREITRIGWDKPYLHLADVAVAVRHPDGSFTVDREPFPAVANILSFTVVGFIAGLVIAAPLAGAAVGAALGGVGSAVATGAGIGDDFVREVEAMMKPGTSALFVLDDQ